MNLNKMLTKTQEQTIREEFKNGRKSNLFEEGEYEQYFVDFDAIADFFINKLNTALEEQKKELVEKVESECK